MGVLTLLASPRWICGVTLLAAAGCSASKLTVPGASDDVQVTLARNAYAAGDTVAANLRNLGRVSVEYAGSLCGMSLQRSEQGDTWSTIVPAPSVCTLELRYLGGGMTVPFGYRLPQNLASGMYRIAMPAPVPEKGQPTVSTTVSPPFSVSAIAPTQP